MAPRSALRDLRLRLPGTVGRSLSGFSINRASATVELVLPRSQPVAVNILAIDEIVVFAALVGSRASSVSSRR